MLKALTKSKQGFVKSLSRLLLGKKTIDPSILDEIETLLITADVGVSLTEDIIAQLTDQLKRNALKDGDAVFDALKSRLKELIIPFQRSLDIDESKKPYIILMVGVNGSGKTTTIGKLAKQLQNQGKTVLLAAGDTFRAAAVEQLKVWGDRNHIPVVAQSMGADSASVIYDAIGSAKAKNIDVVIADTAGRLHTQSHLMEELKKITRVIKKTDETAPHEVMVVLDASLGQNALQQARQFKEAVNVSGVVMTKLDGTARGGIVFAVANQLQLPIRFVGVGEKIDDLKSFDANEFVEALFS
jgi:fused signal recognition particle receptor